MKKVALLCIAAIYSACTQQPLSPGPDYVPVYREATEPDESPDTESEDTKPEKIEPEEEELMYLTALPIYPAYYWENGATLWGIPANLQGLTQKEQIIVEQTNGEPAPVADVFTVGGNMYVKIEYLDPNGIQKTEYHRQAVGTAMIEPVNAEDVPAKPEPSRVVVNLPGFTIEEAEYEGETVSEIWNRHPSFIEPGCPKGCGPFRYPMVTGYAEQERGLLFATGGALLFLPANRSSPNQVAEAGRLWK